jgi:hypothetical protein
MTTITITRGSLVSIPFTITDAANGLAGKRVTLSLAEASGGAAVLAKASSLPGSSASVVITSQTDGAISGYAIIDLADFATLARERYYATLWVDDGAGAEYCVTEGGQFVIEIQRTVPRAVVA